MDLKLPTLLRLNLVLTLIVILSFGLTYGQNVDLAKNYFDQGEYQKAEAIYAKLHEQNPEQQNWLLSYVETLEALENSEKAKQVLKSYLDNVGAYPNIQIELGYLYQKQGDSITATDYYQKAIAQVEARPAFSFAVGNTFQRYGMLDRAIQTYETAQRIQPRINNEIELAKIYGEQSEYVKMFENYIAIIADNPTYFNVLRRNFTDYIKDDSANPANKALRRVLLQRNQNEPTLIYNQLLSWLFVQESAFMRAFAQEKAIYQRTESSDLKRIVDLALIAKDKDDLSSARQMLDFAVEHASNQRQLISAKRELLLVKRLTAAPADYKSIEEEYLGFLAEYGRTPDSFIIQKDLAEFYAYELQDIIKALDQIDRIDNQALYDTQAATLKLLKADLKVQQSKFNQALVLYTQVEKMIPNTDIAREAKFKVAKTSYYKGDFDWALTQLKILKTSASQLIANDAMELSLLIKDNSQEDSTRTDLKRVAEADLLEVQNKPEAAMEILKDVLANYNSPSIVDDVLWRIANLHLIKSEIEMALPYLQRIVDEFNDQILADNANFLLGQLYRNEINNPEQAKLFFETIIFNYPDSIYFVDARKNYRRLRGDQIQ
jgi:tetratricopeptide (TPR) repeat protein